MRGPVPRLGLVRLLPLALLLVPAAQAQDAPDAPAAPVEVHVGIHVLSVGNHDANKGTYVLDFYLVLRWDEAAAPAGFKPDRFEFMNGRATSKELLFDDAGDDGLRELWYRVQASLYAEPRFRQYPFDTQHILLEMEDAVHPVEELVYVPIEGQVGLDDGVHVAGWDVHAQDVTVRVKEYPTESYSRLRYDVEVQRPALGVGLRSFVPPVAFVVIAGIGFFLHPSKVANRLALATGMVISAVGFHVSQTVSLPSLPELTLFDEVMVSVYLFLACCVAVATLIAYNEDHWKREGASHRYNRQGAVVTALVPVLALLLLRLV